MPESKLTFCRICEPACSLIAELNAEGKAISLKPDTTHPIAGTACHKGLSYLDIHNDPDRLNWPIRRTNSRQEEHGKFVETDWDSAVTEIANRLNLLRENYGNDTIGIYYGNAFSMCNPTALLAFNWFRELLGTRMIFGSNTQDTANKFSASAAIYGSTGSVMIPDIANTDFLLCLGTNPKVSRWTTMSIPNSNLAELKQIKQRGGKVRFVNPRQTESSTEETGPTILIKAGTDAYFLAALVHEIGIQGGFDEALILQYAKHIEKMKIFVSGFSAERVAKVTGVDDATVKSLAAEMIAAKSAAVYMATGLNQSRQGMVCYWLMEMINFCTGNLGKIGGTYKPAGIVDYFPKAGNVTSIETSQGVFELPDPLEYAVLPGALFAEFIKNHDIRALLVLGGNPLITVGGSENLREAFKELDFVVSIDILRQATAEQCDYVLPATDWLEHMDITMFGSGMQPRPYVQFADVVEPPSAGRRNSWWMLTRIAQAMGFPSPLDDNPSALDGNDMVNGTLGVFGMTIEQMRELPHNSYLIEQAPHASVFERCLVHSDGKIDCFPKAFSEAGLFTRCEEIFSELELEPEGILKLISLRTPYMQNSWYTNAPKMRLGRHATNPLNICTADAAARGIFDGDRVRLFNKYGSVTVEIFVNDELRPGVVAMTHGYGHNKSFGLSVASRKPGVNCNALMPTGKDTIEPLSYMSWMSAIPVEIQRIEPNNQT